MTIRIITPQELPQLYSLRNEVLRKPLGMSIFNDDLASEHNQIAIGAWQNEVLIGCVMLKEKDSTTYKLRQMAIAHSEQKKGIGAAIVKFAEQLAVERNKKYIELHARITAKIFYEKLCYEPYGNEFLEVNIPHIAMRKTL